jgi:uncharacterized protein involved in exopolysaccharide biosynthesis
MRPYLATARRYWWVLLMVLTLIWGAGLVAGYAEYSSTYSSEATVWVHRAPQDLGAANPDEPNMPLLQTSASQQADLLNQLLQTKSFLRDVVRRTSLWPAIEAQANDAAALEAIGKHFKVQALGTNLISVSYAARDPRTARDMVVAALAVRGERVAAAGIAATTAVSALYQKQLGLAEAKAVAAQRAVDEFNANHSGELSALDSEEWARVRLTLDLANVRVMDLRNRIDQSALAPAILAMSGLEFQVVDEPREESSPHGGTKPALMLAGVAFIAGIALVALLVVIGTFLVDHIAEPADLVRLEPASLFGTVPRVARARGGASRDLRATLAALAFADARPDTEAIKR